ncbi:hypothetical protein P0136_02670 [Lentisphaerota bacterium ZTH]|nr:hypothetical protein JYG24_06190 [Lentisphaerota bacterium]WET06905.1 hypothetical protein P0136_02670 [Lentisphaerota bacterium ZTH]
MARYEEKILNWFPAFLVLGAVFLIIYSPFQIGARELYWQEGYYAVQANEIKYMLPITFAHGIVIQNSFPFYPLLVSLLHADLGLPLEFSLRALSIMSTAGIACMVWAAGRSAGGLQAAAVASAVMISSNIVIEKSMDGYPHTLMLFFLTAAWLMWFTFGAGRGNWNMAWIASMFFCGLAFYTMGFVVLVYFFVPLIFMRRPLTMWPRLRKPGFAAGVVIFLGFVLLWALPHIIYARTMPIKYMTFEPKPLYEYIEHFFGFPLDVLVRLIPWTIMAWAPFCVAFHPLDKSPIFSRFLRTIFVSLFFLLWLSPFSEPRDILLLVPALAIMTGINYWLIIRRYGWKLQRFLNVLPWLSIACGALIFSFYFANHEWWTPLVTMSRGIGFRDVMHYKILGYLASIAATVSGALLLAVRKKPPIWIYMLILLCGPLMFFWSVTMPYKAQADEKRLIGTQLRTVLENDHVPETVTIYKGGIQGLYAELLYMGYKVQKIRKLEDLPASKKIVYLIDTEFPQVPGRHWKNLLPADTSYRKQRICLWKGTLISQKRHFKKWPR